MLKIQPMFASTAAILIWICLAGHSTAQMFGVRSVGRPLSRQTAPGLASGTGAGTIQGGERFLRSNRSAEDFVGIDALDRARFVGQVNATNQLDIGVPAITTAPRVDRTAQINTALKPRPANSLAEPVLLLGFELAPESTAQLAEQARNQIQALISDRFGNQIEVSVEGRTATLRGAVGGAAESQLAASIAALQPGISKVQNQLTWPAARDLK